MPINVLLKIAQQMLVVSDKQLQYYIMMMEMTKKPIGILGGTFDPIHLGHIHLAREVLRQVKLEKILFIPCFRSAHNKTIQATPKQRLEMLKLALAKQPKFSADDREIERQGTSYMVETLESFRRELPKTPLCLLMAKDAFAKFTTWYKWRKIISLAHLIIADREEYQLPHETELDMLLKTNSTLKKKHLIDTLAGKIFFVKIKPLSISATEIRALIKKNENVEHLLPRNVWQYIVLNSLYK